MFGAWVKLLVNSAVVAAVMVAAQLGVGDALGILAWDAPPSTLSWSALKTWIAFCSAVAVIVGALVGRLPVRRSADGEGLASRVVAGLAAMTGAASMIGLAWLHTHDLPPSTNVNPGLDVSITAGGGVLVGFILALLALAAAPVAAGIGATVGWLWLLAVVCAAAGLATHLPYEAPRLGVADAPSLLADSVWTGPRAMIGVAVVVGLVVAGVARARQAGRFGVAFAGFGGPAAIAAAYLVAGPGSGADRTAQSEPWLAALLAAVAGLVASVLVAFPGRRSAGEAGTGHVRPVPAPRAGDDGQPISGEVMGQPPRPAWASASGGYGGGVPYAGAFTSGGSGRAGAASTPVAKPASRDDEASGTGRGLGWDGDTWPGRIDGLGGAQSGRGRHGAGPAGTSAPGIYRAGSASTTDASTADATAPTAPITAAAQDPHESWLRDLGGSGRHSAS